MKCACGCGIDITRKAYLKYRKDSTPKYIKGHGLKDVTFSEKHKLHLRKAFEKRTYPSRKCRMCKMEFTPKNSHNFWCVVCAVKRRAAYMCRMHKMRYAGLTKDELVAERRRKRLLVRRRVIELKDCVHKRLGGKCLRCGFKDSRALQIDHINGGGYAERKKIAGTMATWYMHVLRELDAGKKNKYQLLCANCNWIKRFENGEHKKWVEV